ncbi:Retrovirus-related Pol polyprotein from transposon TNT 1-94 [Vitis vinifera]|uniref:Retrovirus-related Pol polyprotein from transposon TNT 1-94 n=1 Tax=Vitis vinifera TaxID=29760 RepID=A0A438FV67_VITVI|nr:Retrovirus-related Pol polyprotein from transposon TNT 1-94 [Vitis vinifera]
MEGGTIKIMNQDLVRLDRFDGSNFTRWQDKVRFLLTALKIFYILDPTLAPLPEPKENDTPQVVAARKKREEDELICRGHILNALSDRLYDLYTNTNSAREIWEALETIIVNKLKVLKIELPEAFQVGAIVAKLPSSWKGYRKRILHKSEDYSLEEIQKHLRIEEESRSRDKMVEESNGGTNKANAISKANHPRGKNNNNKKNSGNYMSPKKNQEQFKGKKGPCFVCGKPGHYARECRFRKDQKGAVVNAIDEEIIATLSDVCVVQGKVQGWWYDTCATVHVTYDKSLFKTFENAKRDQEVQMGNEGKSKVLGKGTIEVVFTSGKKVTLKNVLYVPDMNKNLVSGDLLGKPGIKAVFEFGRKPNIGYFKVWGCLAYCKKTDPNKTKLGPRAIKCAFVGYASNSKAYRLLDLESNVIIESREVEFFENLLSDSNSQVPTSVGESQEETPSKVVEQPIVPRKSQRARKEKVLGSDEIDSQRISFYLVEGNREDIIRKIPIVLQIEEDPKTYKEAMASRDVAFWKEAINDEMDSIMSNQTWELVDLPPGSKPIGCKWVFRRKYHTDGMIQTFKARLVAKGFKQREGIDYFDTYAPVARTTSIRILFALASIHNLFVHQMDVKTAFLNGDLNEDLNEEVYMEQPEGFVLLGNENKVCKLVKSLYGLKQAPKQWHEKFDHAILSDGFRHNNVDKCLYSKTCDDYMVIVCLYVDDMLILSDDMRGIIETKRFLSSTFKMKDLGEVDTILGIKVKRNSGGYALNQTHYIEKVVSKFSHLKIKDANTPFDSSIKLEKNDVSKLSRFTSNPSVEHWKAIGRVLGYLKNTKELSLQYSKFPAIIEGYSDASWISSVGDNLSTTGWVFTLGGGLSLGDPRNRLVYRTQPWRQMSIYCDSQATLARAYSGVYNGKSRHISIRHEVKLKAFNEIQSMCDKHLKVTRMLEEFHLCEIRGGAASHESWSFFQEVHEWIEHMAIKVLSKKIMGTRVVSGSVCVVTGFVTRNNWFNATSNLGFQRSFVTITLR